jgi:hypothetical protein
MKALGIAPVEKASPDDPKHPGWPAGAPDSQGGRFRPKTPDDYPSGPPKEEPNSFGRMTNALAAAIKAGIRRLAAAGIVAVEEAGPPPAKIAALLLELGFEAYPYLKAYFDSPKSLEELQAAAQSPSEVGYEDHHIVEQATANPDGSEDALMDAPDNLARIPTIKHWELNSWYQTRNSELNEMTPRQYLDGKSWVERLRVGLMGLQDIGALK